MKKKTIYICMALFIISVALNLITVQFLFKTKSDLENSDKSLKLYEKILEIPFVDDKIVVANKEVKINENQKYYLIGGDCSEIVKDGSNYENLTSFNLKESFKGIIDEVIIEKDSYYTILIQTNIHQSGYSNNNFEKTDSSGFSKDVYSTLYRIHLTCQNLDN